MPEKQPEGEEIRVVDRRRFTTEGERRPGVESESPAATSPPPPPASVPQTAAPVAESKESRAAREAYDRQAPRSQPPMDFEALLMSLYTSAMYQLGLVEDPVRGRPPLDLENARHTIDMLAVLEEKSRGNLTPREQQLLEQALYELRVSYVTLSSGQKPPARQPRR